MCTGLIKERFMSMNNYCKGASCLLSTKLFLRSWLNGLYGLRLRQLGKIKLISSSVACGRWSPWTRRQQVWRLLNSDVSSPEGNRPQEKRKRKPNTTLSLIPLACNPRFDPKRLNKWQVRPFLISWKLMTSPGTASYNLDRTIISHKGL